MEKPANTEILWGIRALYRQSDHFYFLPDWLQYCFSLGAQFIWIHDVGNIRKCRDASVDSSSDTTLSIPKLNLSEEQKILFLRDLEFTFGSDRLGFTSDPLDHQVPSDMIVIGKHFAHHARSFVRYLVLLDCGDMISGSSMEELISEIIPADGSLKLQVITKTISWSKDWIGGGLASGLDLMNNLHAQRIIYDLDKVCNIERYSPAELTNYVDAIGTSTTGRIETCRIKELDEPGPPITVVWCTHSCWCDFLLIRGDDFRRLKTGCSGRIDSRESGRRVLVWNQWPVEVLDTNNHITPLSNYTDVDFAEKVENEIWQNTLRSCSTSQICIVTFSRARLPQLCAAISFMRGQNYQSFCYVIHLIEYSNEQFRFLREFIGNDDRILLKRVSAASQKEQFRRILQDGLQTGASVFIRIDDDDVYTPTFLGTILENAEGFDFACGQTLLYHTTWNNCSWVDKRSRIFGNNMYLTRGVAEFALRQVDSGEFLFEDGQLYSQLSEHGYSIRIFQLQYPEVIYVRHGANTST